MSSKGPDVVSKLTLLHLSDLHWAPHLATDLTIVTDALQRDLQSYCATNGIEIDAIIFSGDLALGGDEPDWFKQAYERFLKPVSKTCDVPFDRVYVAPGNHDIAREHVRKIPSIHQGLEKQLTSVGDVNRLIDINHVNGSEVHQSLGRMRNFYDHHDAENPDHQGHSVFFRTHKFQQGDRSIGVASFNSAWMATGEGDDVDFRKLVLGERAVDLALADLTGCDFKIAVHHHPLDWLRPHDGDAVDLLLRRAFDLSCSGHVHQARPTMSLDASGTCVTSQAGSVYAGREFFNGYQIVEIDLPARDYVFHVREYINRRREFAPAVRVSGDGKLAISAPKKNQSKIEKVELFLRGSRSRVREILEQQMTLAGGDGDAPGQFLMDTFVVPPLAEKRYADLDGDGHIVKNIEVNDFLFGEDNCVFIGTRHSGKTTLAYYLTYMIAFGPHTRPQIPVYIDTRSFKFNPYAIRSALGHFFDSSISNQDAKDYAKEGLFSFIFDNCEADAKTLAKIAGFADDYPECRHIVFTSPNTDGVSPDRFINENLPEFTKIYIEDLNRGRIRALSKQWAANRDDGDELYDLVINQLVRDGLPRTPYMVSLLIWAIKQKKKMEKINEAILLQAMMDHLLGKADFRLAKRGALNPIGKEITLQNFASFAKAKGSVVQEDEAVQFLIDFFKRKRLPFIGADVLEKLIDCGILSRKGDEIAFRYEAFQEYFLAKHFLNNKKELSVVLADLNFLNFRREIELLAGLQPENDELIDAISKVLNDRVPRRFLNCDADKFDEIASSELDIHLTRKDLKKIKETRLTQEQIDEMLDEADRRALSRGDRTVRESLNRAGGNLKAAVQEREAEGIEDDRKTGIGPMRPSTHMAAVDLLARVIRNSDFTDYEVKGPATKRVLDSWTKIFVLIMEEIDAMLDAPAKQDDAISDEVLASMRYFLAKLIFGNISGALIHHIASPTIAETLHSLIEEGEFSSGEHLLSIFILEDIDDEKWQELWSDQIEKEGQSGFVIDSFVQRLLYLTYSKALDAKQERRVDFLVDKIEKRLGWSTKQKSEVLQQMKRARDLRRLADD